MTDMDEPTRNTRKRFDRIAFLYDQMEGLVERFSYGQWRKLLWEKLEGDKVLEVGVGTGKNFPYYPMGTHITAIDFSPKMLKRAWDRASKDNIKVELQQMDIQEIEFEDNSFDTVVGSFVFCSVPDPVRGLEEVKRVVKPGGKVILLEHVLSANRILAGLMNLVNPFIQYTMGPNINRRTVQNVIDSGLVVERVTNLKAGIFKLIEARKSPS